MNHRNDVQEAIENMNNQEEGNKSSREHQKLNRS